MFPNRRTIAPILFTLLSIFCLFYSGSFAQKSYAAPSQTFLWIEGENPTTANFKYEKSGFGAASVLSSGVWLQKSVDGKDKIKAAFPPEGGILTYNLTVKEAGAYEIWARVGFEGARAPFEWRLGNGAWQRVAPEAHTTNLMRLATWVEVAWLKLGKQTLTNGKTALQFRYREPNGDRLLVALDAAVLVKGTFVPDGALKPGETYTRPADKAAAQIYPLPAGNLKSLDGKRTSVTLNGLWQVARFDDPNMDEMPYAPVSQLPKPDGVNAYPLHWLGVKVPSNSFDTPELHFADRILYRTRVAVPAALAGHSFLLHFSATNWIVSVFVNGKFVSTHKGVLVPWDADITRGVLPGQANLIEIAVKSPAYARDAKAMGNTTLEKTRNLPLEAQFLGFQKWVAPIYPSSKGEGDGLSCGLVAPVTLTATGSVYVEDAFIRSSFAKKQLDIEVRLSNPDTTSAKARRVKVRAEAVNAKTGEVEKVFTQFPALVRSQDHTVLSIGGEWANPKPWFPVDNPDRYILRTTVLDERNVAIDVHEQPFGFCEVTTDGTNLRINGVIRHLWNWVEVSGGFKTPEEFLTKYRAEGNRFYRFSADSDLRKFFPYREAMLDYFDRAGIVGRLSTSIDGMFITYDLHNPLVWSNFSEHLQQVARAYRNHPSVLVYSVENELMYINGQNVYGGEMDALEAKLWSCVQDAKRLDPSRPFMADGAGALVKNLLDIDCPHYPEPAAQFYPETSYTHAQIADHSARWQWDRKRPMIVGESFFYAGKLEDQAWIGGDNVFRGRDEANLGAAAYVRLLVEGYRWDGVTGICPWVALEKVPGADKSFSDLAVFTRKRAYRAYAGKPNEITVKVFNDTLKNDPVTFAWEVTAGGKKIAGETETLALEAGTAQERTLKFTPPVSRSRVGGTLTLRVSQNGKVGFEDTKSLSILPETGDALAKIPVQTPLWIFDRSGKLAPALQAHGIKSASIRTLDSLRDKSGVLLIGANSLDAEEAFSSQILAFAARGGRVIALEQQNPLAGGALPSPVRPTIATAGYAFPQALGTSLFTNLRRDDFTDWAGDFPTVLNAYAKPSGGAKSLIECGDGLNLSGLLEAPCGQGVIVACQLRVGAKLGIEPAADQLLANLLTAYSDYKPAKGTVAVLSPSVFSIDPPVQRAIDATGVLSERVGDLGSALNNGTNYRVLVVPGTAQNLATLNQNAANVQNFTKAGGWVMLCGVTPDALADFNRLTGTDRPIRSFRLERVTKEAAEHPLLATLGNRDLTFYGAQEIAFGDYFLSENVYTYVVGASTNVAPFEKMPEGPNDPLAPYKPTFSDNDPYNYVNGLLNSDSWRYIRQIGVGAKGSTGTSVTFDFFKPETIAQVNLWNNVNYFKIENLDVIVDGDTANPISVTLPPTGNLTEVKLTPARRVTKSITLRIKTWRGDAPGYTGPRLVGLDNVQFLREISDDKRKKTVPLDNLGGLVAYPNGNGGILLNQIKLMDDDPNPQNYSRKIRLVSTLLQNMGAGTKANSVLIPGVNVTYAPLDLTRYANRYLKPPMNLQNQSGAKDGVWFATGQDMSLYKVGTQTLADIEFLVSDYANAPVPQVLMLGSNNAPDPLKALPREIKGIVLNRKADTLSFLQTAWVTNPVQAWERGDRNYKSPEIVRYRVNYADGSTAEIPVRLEENVEHWLQKSPKSLSGAALAWHVPFANAQPGSETPTLYAMTWTNPKPDVAIASLDMVSGVNGERAVPVLLAVTIGTQRR